MNLHKVFIFKAFPFQSGQRIRIEDGPRKGDWEVVSANERKVKFRCPISGHEYEWDRFCYLSGEQENVQWPKND